MSILVTPHLARARYPKDVKDGSLVYAPYGDDFFPAIKWSGDDDGDIVHGLAYLCPIPIESGKKGYPISMLHDRAVGVVVVNSPWHIRVPIDRAEFSLEHSLDLEESGLAFGDETFLRIPFMSGNARSTWQLIDLTTGTSKLEYSDNKLIFITGWELFLGDDDKPLLTWPRV